jgi:perosamine synthetase
MEAARKLAREHDLVIVEDAAQSLGSRSAGKHLGTFGDVGSFSFSAPKVITTGQGGALITDSEDLMEKIRRIKDFGRSRGGIDEHEVIGFNFKFTDLQAVVGIEQMKKLEWRVDRKKEIFALYRDELAGVRQVEFIETDLDDTSPWFIDVLVPEREDLRSFLKSKGIGSRPFYPPIHRQAAYAIEGNYPVSEEVSAHGLWLPSSSSLRDEDVDRICREMSMFFSPSS